MSPIFPAVRSALRTGAPWKRELAAATADLMRPQSVALPTGGWVARAGALASGATLGVLDGCWWPAAVGRRGQACPPPLEAAEEG